MSTIQTGDDPRWRPHAHARGGPKVRFDSQKEAIKAAQDMKECDPGENIVLCLLWK